MPSQELHQTKVDAFGQQMASVLNGAAIALMASIGHQTGLFDTMARLPPSTSAEIATAANLQERYVREWLGALVAGCVIDYDPVQATYRLPPEACRPPHTCGWVKQCCLRCTGCRAAR